MSTLITTRRTNNELYVYRLGRLLYKRWFDKDGKKTNSRMFHGGEGETQFTQEGRQETAEGLRQLDGQWQ